MSDLLLQTPRGTYDGKVTKYTDIIELYETYSVMEFAFIKASIATGAAMGTKKGVIGLLRCILPANVWKTHLLDPSGERLQIRDVSIHAIIQVITTKSAKPGSQDTHDALNKCQ